MLYNSNYSIANCCIFYQNHKNLPDGLLFRFILIVLRTHIETSMSKHKILN
jgi:hypothetical protein